MELKEVPVEIRNKALREAMGRVPVEVLRTVLADCGLTAEEQKSLLEHRTGTDLTRIGGELYLSDRTVDRRRRSALDKLRVELEQ